MTATRWAAIARGTVRWTRLYGRMANVLLLPGYRPP